MEVKPKGKFKFFDYLLLVTFSAFALRLFFVFPSLSNPENFLRLDSGGFIPCMQGFDWGARAPFYAFILGIFAEIFRSIYLVAGIFGIVISSASVFISGLIGRELSSERGGIIAAILFALNITSIGVAPLILSDTFFAFWVGLEILYAIKFYKNGTTKELAAAAIFGVIASLTRSVNLPIMLIGISLLILISKNNGRKKLFLCGINYLILLVAISPFCLINYFKGAAFTLEYNAPKALIHNSAAIISYAENRPTNEILNEKMSELDSLVQSKNLSISERNSFIVKEYFKIVKKYPLAFIRTHFPQIWIMVPDLPSFCENLGITKGDKGTLSVIRQKGIIAGIKYYFGERAAEIILAVTPLLLATLIGYIGCLIEVIRFLKDKKWQMLLIFLIFSLLFVVLPGPVIMPRYHLPALFLIFAFAGKYLEKFKIRTVVSCR